LCFTETKNLRSKNNEEEVEMLVGGKEQKNSYQINLRLILGLVIVLGFFTVIIITVMLTASERIAKKSRGNSINSQNQETVVQQGEDNKASLLGVFKMLDEGSRQVGIFDIIGRRELLISYSGSSNIRDEYGQIIAISQIEPGTMVELKYIKDNGKMTDMIISDKAWKYVSVSNFTLDPDLRIMKIAKKQYKLADELLVLDGNDFVSIYDIAQQDVLTVWGYEETIWSVIVSRGHGYVKLKDYEEFLGDYITVGYEAMQQITEDMTITVREGDFNLTVESGDFSATIRVRVKRNEITYVSLKELGPKAPKYGSVMFDISPFGADLYIKGELRSYANEIELPYGTYPIKVSLGGYVSYEGNINVDSPAKTIKIILPESSSNKKVEVTETNTKSSSDYNTGSPATDGQGSGNKAGGNDNSDFIIIGDKIIDTKHQIHVQKPVGASVYLNGEYMGTSPVSFSKIIGSHVITFIREGYETISYTVDVINDGKDAYFKFDDLVPNAIEPEE